MSNDYWKTPPAAQRPTRAEIRAMFRELRESIAQERAAAKERRRLEALASIKAKTSLQ